VASVAESFPGSSDLEVLKRDVDQKRILLTEDKDFGEWVFAHKEEMYGVLFIRYPASLRANLGEMVRVLVTKHGSELVKSFIVLEPGKARIRKMS